MMKVQELSGEQLDELKQAYICETIENPSYGELADATEIPDDIVFEYYAGFDFVDDDFFCTAGKE